MVKIKICGLTNFEDAFAALMAGANYLGFILYPPSPRAIGIDDVRQITQELRKNPESSARFLHPDRPRLVGVFVNEAPETIAGILDECGLDLAQMSGEEPPEQLNDPASPIFGLSYKALRPASIDEAKATLNRYMFGEPLIHKQVLPQILLDTPHGQLFGGTGLTGNWDMGAELAANVPGLMLAGGLTPENVAEAVRRVRPFAVDVASGVESSPGRKDHLRMRAFIHNAKSA